MTDLFRLSQPARSMRPSPIRELFAMISRPGMISFAGGLPDPAAFPVAEFAACAEVLERDGREVLQYGASEGYGPLREELLSAMTERLGYQVSGAELLITSGSQQAANLIARTLVDPGDAVVVEAPTYPGTLHSFRNAGARFVCVPCDGDGMRVDELPAAADRCREETGRLPKLIYTVPDFSNPSGACMSLDRRRRLLEHARTLRIPVLEDDPYGRLRYSGEEMPTLKSLAAGSPLVVYASSFSKVLAPGVRVAWTVADPEITRSMVLMRQGEDLCTSTVTQALVAEYCRRGQLEKHLVKMIGHYAAKCGAMQRSLAAHLPPGAAEWHVPEGGFFFWLRLPGLDSGEVFARAVEEGVAFVPGPAFYPGAGEQQGTPCGGTEHARLTFTFADDDAIDEGCGRLAAALDTPS
jgi:2-aminoadipate transaminase